MGAGVRMLKSGLFCPGMRRSWTLSRQVSEARFPGKRWLVAGLGNPGMPGTRHSVGMAVLGQIAQRLGVAENWARDSRCAADLALAPFGDAQLVLLRPRRLMNVNGRSVAKAAELFGLSAEEIYLVHDELDKPLGKLALKLGGSARTGLHSHPLRFSGVPDLTLYNLTKPRSDPPQEVPLDNLPT
ncbi:peptidyl-tRNA hydrolase isoform X1 [Rattus norvegicus]|uniref:peptidyl-tRNA hydrolase isoform X1 n=1 Tax=Rattus norvegicus TaxID=10116 RepID=UPI0003D09F7F|eukprot:XP_006234076.1 PREDICTED: probable peptidyl-tRNA hydrolase isoform X2 [Rattus norvegicus]